MLKAERQQKTGALAEKLGVVTVADLAKSFRISPITIRRDLDELHAQGLLKRTHGGAVALNFDTTGKRLEGSPYAEREQLQSSEKSLIANEAAKAVSDGDSLILNAGTTMHRFAEAIKDRKDLKIITNGITVAAELVHSVSAHVVLIGGTVDFTKMATVGSAAQDALKDTHVPRAFLGVSGISVKEGLLMLTPQEAEINRSFIAAAQRVIVLVDSTKFRSQAIYRVAPLAKVDRIVTDSGVSSEDREQIRKLGIELQIVRKSNGKR